MREELLTLNDLLKLGAQTLQTLPDGEVDCAVQWLEDNVVPQKNVASQLILLQTWQSIWGRNIFERIYQDATR